VYDNFSRRLLIHAARILLIILGFALVAKFFIPIIFNAVGSFILLAILFYALKRILNIR